MTVAAYGQYQEKVHGFRYYTRRGSCHGLVNDRIL